jgi:hypothetical protein
LKKFLKEIATPVIKVKIIFALNMEAAVSFEMLGNTEENIYL